MKNLNHIVSATFPQLQKAVLFFLSFFLMSNLWAQNCTVNAGIDKLLCAGGSEIQEGNIGGNFVVNTVLWTQISGPNSATITNNTSLSPTISNLISGTYIFQMQATCQIGGLATDQVTYTVQSGAVPVAPTTIVVGCYTPGTPINLVGTAPPGHTLSWSFVSSTAPTTGTFNGNTQTGFTGDNPTVQFSAPILNWCYTGIASEAVIRVRSTSNATNCYEDRLFKIFMNFNPGPVTATASSINPCSSSLAVSLFGSCQGTGTGTWSVISSPGGAPIVSFSPNANSSIVNLGNLIAGNYTFRWTVSGAPCSNGFADVSITVNNSGGTATIPHTSSKKFCAGALPSTVSLEGTLPLPGESVLWSQIGGAPITITNATSPHAQAIGLTEAGSPYLFTYTITGTGSCSLSDTMEVSITTPLNYQPTNSGYCNYANQNYISGFLGSIPFMQSDSVQVSMIYESGPANNMQIFFEANMVTQSGVATGVTHYSPTINITRGGSASHNFLASTLWPTYNQYSAILYYWFSTSNNIPSCTNILPGVYRFRLMFKDDCGSFTSQPFEVIISSVATFNAGSDQMLPCGNTSTTLAGNALRCEINPFWTTVKKPAAAPDPINAGNKSNPNAALSVLQNGSYIFKWESIASGYGCPVNSDSVRITVATVPPAVPVVAGGGTYCVNVPVAITGELNDDAANGTWTVTTSPLGGAYTISPSVNSPSIVFTPSTANTTYTLTWNVANGCGTSFASTNVITGLSSALVPNITNLNNCSAFGAFGTLTATGVGGVWTSSNPNYTLVAPNSTSTTVSPASYSSALGAVTFYYTISGPCGALSDSVTFTSSVSPTMPSNKFCTITSFPTSQNITLGGLLPYATYEITGVTGPGTATIMPMTFVPTGNTYSLTLNASQAGSFVIGIAMKMGKCAPVNYSFTVELSGPAQLAIAGPDISLCGLNVSTTLNALPNPLGTSSGAWSVQTVYSGMAPLFSNASSPTSQVMFSNGAGDVLLKWSVTGDNANCGGSTSDYLRIRAIPFANAGQDDFTCYDATTSPASMTLNANSTGPATGSWSIIFQPPGSTASFINSSMPNTSIIGMINGFYTLRWTVTDPMGTCPPTTDDIIIGVYLGCILLPVELADFSATLKGSDVNANWFFKSEEENGTYVLERAYSPQGPFTSIAFVKYNASNKGRYSYWDRSVNTFQTSALYYRLKTLSANNKVSYSKIARVQLKQDGGIDVFPTLVAKGGTIIVQFNKSVTDSYQLTMTSMQGQLIKQENIVGVRNLQLPTSRLAAGSYIIQVNNGKKTYTWKIIIE